MELPRQFTEQRQLLPTVRQQHQTTELPRPHLITERPPPFTELLPHQPTELPRPHLTTELPRPRLIMEPSPRPSTERRLRLTMGQPSCPLRVS